MKKTISLIVALAAVFSLVTVPVSAAYTEGSYFNGAWSSNLSDRSTVTIVTTETVADGAPESDPGESQALNGLEIDGHAIRVSSYKDNDAYFRQQVAVETGKTYRLTGKIRTGRAVNDQTWLLITGSVWTKSSEYRIASLNTVAGAYRDWRNFDYTFTNNTTGSYLTFYTQNWGSMLLDNLSLKEVLADGYGEELLRYGDFEPKTYTETNYFNEVWYANCIDRSNVTVVTTETVADGAPESDPGESNALDGLEIDGHAVRVSSYTGNDAYFRQQVPVENGKTYRLTGKIRTGRTNDDQTWLLITGSTWSKGSEYRIASLNAVAGAARDFRDFDYTFTNNVADNCKYLTFYTQNWGSMLLDNLSLKEVLKDENGDPILDANGAQCYSEELIRNGDFEPTAETSGSSNAIAGWSASWNTPREDCEAGIDLIEDSLGKYVMSGVVYPVSIPQGRGMAKIWQGDAASDSNFNATLLQRLTGMDTTKTYLLTGKIWVNSNQTKLQLLNTDFNSGNAMDIYTYYGNNRHRWEDLSIEFTPTNSNVEVKFQTAKSGRKIYLDNLSIKEIEKEDGTIVRYGEELLTNGDFEDNFKVPTEAGRYYLDDVEGWGASFWNIPQDGYEAGIDVLENIVGTPEGSRMLKIWTAYNGESSTPNYNSNAIQRMSLDTSKTYRLTGKIKFSNNGTAIKLVNTDFNSGNAKSLVDIYGSENANTWQNISIDFTPNNKLVELQISANIRGRTVYVDNLSVRELIDGAPGNKEYIANGGFEGRAVPVFTITRGFYASEDGEEPVETTSSLTSIIDDFGMEYLCAQAEFVNTKYNAQPVNVFLATYKDEVLEDVISTTAVIENSNEAQTLGLFCKLPDMSSGDYKCKLFIWDTDLIPLCREGVISE